MDHSTAAVTTEQLRALQAGEGIAHLQDPATGRTYVLIDQGEQPTLPDEYFCEKVREGLEESRRGESTPWDVDRLKQDLLTRREDRRPRA